MINVIDNWLENDLSNFVEQSFLHEYPHFFDHTPTHNDNNFFYNCELNHNDTLVKFLFYKAKKTLNRKIKLVRTHFNIQHPGMDGGWHTDDSELSFVYMVTQTLNKKEGTFQAKINNKIKTIDFVKNRLLFFDSKILHKGNAPFLNKKRNVNARITFTLKVNYD